MIDLWDRLGQFWLAVFGFIAAQWLLTEEVMTKKQTAAAILCGVLAAWFWTWPIAESFAISEKNTPIVAGLLALTGRQTMAIAIKRVPEIVSGVMNIIIMKSTGFVSMAIDAWASKRMRGDQRQERNDETEN